MRPERSTPKHVKSAKVLRTAIVASGLILFTLVAAYSFMLLAQWYLGELNRRATRVTAKEAYELINSEEDIVVLDVRDKSEYDSGHIKGAILIPVNELQSRIGELSKDRKILVYDNIGIRSERAREILMINGFTKVYDLKGGLLAWENAGYTLETTQT